MQHNLKAKGKSILLIQKVFHIKEVKAVMGMVILLRLGKESHKRDAVAALHCSQKQSRKRKAQAQRKKVYFATHVSSILTKGEVILKV